MALFSAHQALSRSFARGLSHFIRSLIKEVLVYPCSDE